MTIANSQFSTQFAALLQALDNHSIDGPTFTTQLSSLIDLWNNGSVSNAQLAIQIGTFVSTQQTREGQLQAWWTGSATGGTKIDGTGVGGCYPFTDVTGATTYRPSPALIGAPFAGPAGTAATITIGSVVAGPVATVTNVGNATAAVLNITLPPGAKGDPGATGGKGDQGVQGVPGQAASLSFTAPATLTAGSQPTVTNTGNATAAVVTLGLPVGPQPWTVPAPFAAGIVAMVGPPATAVTYGGSTYICKIAHTTTSSFVAANWINIAAAGQNGTGTGTVLPTGSITVGHVVTFASADGTQIADGGQLAAVAESGSYTDLINKPALFSGDYNALVNRPALVGVATSGDYNSLINRPSVVTNNNGHAITLGWDGARVTFNVDNGGAVETLTYEGSDAHHSTVTVTNYVQANGDISAGNRIRSNGPGVVDLININAGADQKTWRWIVSNDGQELHCETVNDAYNAVTSVPLKLNRTSGLTLNAAFTLTGKLNGYNVPGLDAGVGGNNVGQTWPHLLTVKTDGGTEGGQYFDFHESSAVQSDYHVRLYSSGSNLIAVTSNGQNFRMQTDGFFSAPTGLFTPGNNALFRSANGWHYMQRNDSRQSVRFGPGCVDVAADDGGSGHIAFFPADLSTLHAQIWCDSAGTLHYASASGSHNFDSAITVPAVSTTNEAVGLMFNGITCVGQNANKGLYVLNGDGNVAVRSDPGGAVFLQNGNTNTRGYLDQNGGYFNGQINFPNAPPQFNGGQLMTTNTQQYIGYGSFKGFQSYPSNPSIAGSTAGDLNGLSVYSDSGGPALATFHRHGQYACFFGLDVDNEFRRGGWSDGQGSWRFWTERNVGPLNDGSHLRSFNGDGTNWITTAEVQNATTVEYDATTNGGTFTFDFNGVINTAVFINANTTFAAANLKNGRSGWIRLRQDGTGGRIGSWTSTWKFPNGAAPALSTAANAIDILVYSTSYDGVIYANILKGFA